MERMQTEVQEMVNYLCNRFDIDPGFVGIEPQAPRGSGDTIASARRH